MEEKLKVGRPKEINGLGDTIEWITVKTGVKKIIYKYWDCDCDGRRKKWNKLVPFKKK